MKETIAAVVVTYNRKELLIECLNAIIKQTFLPNAIFIIDNLSNDDTPQKLFEANYINELPALNPKQNQTITNKIQNSDFPSHSIEIIYTRKAVNDGGAGGFYEGMKQAYNAGYDWIWMMDDDGLADKNQLAELLKTYRKYTYRNALVVDIDDPTKLSFGIKNYKTFTEIVEKDTIEKAANPFNGTFIHREIPEKIGFIKKEMFIWGDESEYLNRAIKYGFEVATIIKAKHYHPRNKGKVDTIIPFINKGTIVIKPQRLAHIYYRNLGFIQNEYSSLTCKIKTVVSYSLYFIARLRLYSLFKFINYYIKGLRNDYR